jgi:hypothetical protein
MTCFFATQGERFCQVSNNKKKRKKKQKQEQNLKKNEIVQPSPV